MSSSRATRAGETLASPPNTALPPELTVSARASLQQLVGALDIIHCHVVEEHKVHGAVGVAGRLSGGSWEALGLALLQGEMTSLPQSWGMVVSHTPVLVVAVP